MELTKKQMNELLNLTTKINRFGALASTDFSLFSNSFIHVYSHVFRSEPHYEYTANNYSSCSPKIPFKSLMI